MSQSHLYVSAVKFELQPLLEVNPDVDVYEFGIGALETESRSREIFEKTKDRDVIYVGTCGVLDKWEEPYLISPSHTSWLPLCERIGLSWPLPALPTYSLRRFSSLRSGHVLCSTHIAKSSEVSEDIQTRLSGVRDEIFYENLELYSFVRHATQCRSLKVVLGVSNEVCIEGRQQWKENFRVLAKKTCDFLCAEHNGQ
ncbi:MAG: hypothetical protein AB8C84_13260 [Oligoflexales bacterium]